MGTWAGAFNTGTFVCAMGYSAAIYNKGSNTVAIGRYAAENNEGNFNIAIGDSAMSHWPTSNANHNIAIGYRAGDSLYSGENNIAIGRFTMFPETFASNQINIGNYIYKRANGNVGIGTDSPDQTFSVNGDASKIGGGAWLTFSDKRLKKDIHPFTDGLHVLQNIHPVRYKYNGLAGHPDDSREYVGVVAQDIEKVAPYMVERVSKKLHEADPEETELLIYDANALVYVLTNAVKEQQVQIEELFEEVALLRGKLEEVGANNVSD
jgi:hypothetical protein